MNLFDVLKTGSYKPLAKIGNSFLYSGDLNLRDTAIESLPDNFIVEGNLSLSETNITKLPNNLIVDRRGSTCSENKNYYYLWWH